MPTVCESHDQKLATWDLVESINRTWMIEPARSWIWTNSYYTNSRCWKRVRVYARKEHHAIDMCSCSMSMTLLSHRFDRINDHVFDYDARLRSAGMCIDVWMKIVESDGFILLDWWKSPRQNLISNEKKRNISRCENFARSVCHGCERES